ncbi:MAG: hypothetical protein QMD65_00945 [Patescibacteria group bacterium]|nr:hypothetical protein [Patescibacteria group bacterium]
MDFLFGSFLTWLPRIFWWLVFVFAAILYIFRNKQKLFFKLPTFLNYRFLIKSSIIFRIFYAILLTAGQYYIWSADAFGKLFLNSPLNSAVPLSLVQKLPWLFNHPLGYFIFYSWGRFWLNVFVSIGVALLFFWFLKFLKKHKERFFEEGEIELGFLCMLILNWPVNLIYVLFVFVFVVISSIFRSIVLKRNLTTLGLPFIFSSLILLIWGNALLMFLNLGILKI